MLARRQLLEKSRCVSCTRKSKTSFCLEDMANILGITHVSLDACDGNRGDRCTVAGLLQKQWLVGQEQNL